MSRDHEEMGFDCMAGECVGVNQQYMVNPPMRGAQVEPVCITAPIVSGFGETEVLERIVLDLDELALAAITALLLPTAIGPVVEVVALSKRVTITDCEVFTNKVLINGLLHKDLLFKFAAITLIASLLGIVVTANDCTVTIADTLDLILDCPFGACITVPGACPGDQCFIETACIDAERETLIDNDADGAADLFEEKVCIRIAVKTIRNQQVTITPTEPNICPGPAPTPVCPTVCLPQQGLPTSVTVVRGPGGTILGGIAGGLISGVGGVIGGI